LFEKDLVGLPKAVFEDGLDRRRREGGNLGSRRSHGEGDFCELLEDVHDSQFAGIAARWMPSHPIGDRYQQASLIREM
jgi:hypothetical protein